MFANGNYAKVWGVDNQEKYSVVQLSTSRKNKATDAYETDFSSNFVRFIGDAHKKAANLDRDDRIKFESVGVTTSKVNDKWYTNFLVFDFSFADTNKNSNVDEGFDEDEEPI